MKKIVLTLFAATVLFNFMNAQVSAYPFTQTSGTYTAITGGTLLGSATSDEEVFVDPAIPAGGFTSTGVGFPIGFNFTYNGLVFDRLAVNTNGWISLGQSSLTPLSVDIVSSDDYSPIAGTSTATPTLKRNRIAGLAADLAAQTGSSLRIQTIGTTPNQVCVIQWTNYSKFSETGDLYNFQIRLKETSNNVEVVYGAITNNATSETVQVGLGGTTETDFNLRTTTTNWASTTAGTFNTDVCTLSSTVVPTSGQTFTWSTPSVCSGTPGTITASGPTGACSGVNFNLVATGYSTGVSGITFQWQSSSTLGGTYSNIAGATTSTYAATQTAATYYKCIVTCTGSTQTSTSNIVTVIMNTGINCYCAATNGGGSCITNVTLNTLNRTSAGCENSPTYSTTVPIGTATTTVYQGVSTPLSVSIDNSGAAIISVWIDYNQNGIFEASEWTQVATNALVSTTSTVNILIPGSATLGQTGMRVRSRGAGNSNGSGDACLAMGSGETEDYIITIAAGTPCTGAPTAGTASGPSGACSGVNFNLALTGYTSGVSGITLQWQSSSTLGGTYSNIAGATSSTYSASQTATTYYKCIVTCSGGSSAASNIVTVTLNTGINCYCAATNQGTSCITNVTLNTLNRTSAGCENAPTYSTSVPIGTATTTVNQAQSYSLSVTIDNSSAAIISVWIDYNQNGIFEASEWTQVATNALVSTASTVNILIPGSAILGQTGMRVRTRNSGSPNGSGDACLAMGSGETEDYIITIGAGTACSGTPTVGTASASNDTVCNGVNFDLILTGYTSGVAGLTFQWQSSSTLGGTYTNITGATTPTFTTTQTATTYYKCIVTCSGGTPVTSNIVTVLLNPIMNCYCTSTGTNVADEDIFNVTVGTLNNSSTCATTGGTGSVMNKYSNYTAVAAPSMSRSTSIPFSVQIGTCGTVMYENAFKIFIDYNQNGSFADAGEKVFASDTTKGAHTKTGTFTVPLNAVLGNTMMRVVCKETTDTSTISSCGTYSYGETEDYLVNITSLAGIEENTISGITIYPNPANGLFNITTSNANFTELMISVFDIQGKEVFSALDKNISSNYNKQINLEGLAKGIYYIKLNTGTGVKIQKLIIQ